MREIYIFVKTFEKYLFYICDQIYNVRFHEIPRYYDKEVQFVILLKIVTPQQYDGFLVSQTCHIKEVRLYSTYGHTCNFDNHKIHFLDLVNGLQTFLFANATPNMLFSVIRYFMSLHFL